MNHLDKQYQTLLQTILDYGIEKGDRTGTGTKSIFGYTIRHNMKEGFPLITTKKMPFHLIAIELMWFLRGDTNIKYLVDNDCHIWTGDCYKKYETEFWKENPPMAGPYTDKLLTTKEFTDKIKTDDAFAKNWGDLGPIYGSQWRAFGGYNKVPSGWNHGSVTSFKAVAKCDQIANLISDLKTNPDSRRLMVTAWNPAELDQMVLPPCHYGFQVYTRELTLDERMKLLINNGTGWNIIEFNNRGHEYMNEENIPTRAISLIWNQRSVDTFLGLPFNIASYGLLLEIIAKEVNMVPDELIGNLGDTHLYLNHIEQAKEQIGRKLTHDERVEIACKPENGIIPIVPMYGDWDPTKEKMNQCLDEKHIPHRTREPYPLPKLIINDEFWNHDYQTIDGWINSIEIGDFQVEGYQFHPHIKAPLSN